MTDSTVGSSSGFYMSSEESEPLAYSIAHTSDVPVQASSSGTRPPLSPLPNIATSPELDTGDELDEELRPVRPRCRSKSAPSVLYQQVALELRHISDTFNQEYSREEPAAGDQQLLRDGRRRSLPDVHRHEPRSPNWLHRMIQTFRRESNTPSQSRSRNSSRSSIPPVPEESMDIEHDELDQGT